MNDDLINRQDAIDVIEQLEIPEDMCVFEILSHIELAIGTLPSAQPERKKGKWIKIGHFGRSYKCNQCGNSLDFDGVNVGRGDANFCPNCGADMRGDVNGG